MATVATPVRQPFGTVTQARLRTIQSVKNRQNNVILSNSKSSLGKRRAPTPDHSDGENVDPSTFSLDTKRKKGSFEDDVCSAKAARICTYVTPREPNSPASASTFPKENVIALDAQSRSATRTNQITSVAAGRSPPRPFNKPVSRRRPASVMRGITSPSLSVAAALRGTLVHKSSRPSLKRASTIEDVKPKSWDFAIFEESEDQQDLKIDEWNMTQSSATLHISDAKNDQFDTEDEDNKENVDPDTRLVTGDSTPQNTSDVSVDASVKDDTMDGSRTPLSNLDVASFYGEGLSATSIVLVQDDTDVTPLETESPVVPIAAAHTFDFQASTPVNDCVLPTDTIPEWAQRFSRTATFTGSESVPLESVPAEDLAPIEIWESESAKDENENTSAGSPTVIEDGQSAWALQEL